MEANIFELSNSTGPAQVLIASIWQGLLLTACVWAGLKLAGAFGFSLRASTRFALWLSVFLLVAFLPGLAVVRGLLTNHTSATPAPAVAAFSLQLEPYWAFALEGLWAIASLFSFARLVAAAVQMRALLKGSVPVAPGDLDDELTPILARSAGRPIEIRLSEAIDAPSAIGFFRPTVVVPRCLWTELSPVELRHILLHEVAHLKRGDDWTNLLQKLLRALCPLNPGLLWAERHLCQERERACDDAVLDAAGNARAYATCLTRLAESRLVRRAASLAPGLWKHPSELASRVDNILHPRRSLSPLFSRGLLTALLLASLTGAIMLQRCPGLIAFTSVEQAAPTVAVDEDLSSAPIVRARYQNPEAAGLPKAGYHDAVFHPSVQNTTATLAKPVKAAPRARKARLAYPGKLRMVELRSTQQGSEMFTLIVFTVEMPQNARTSHGALPLIAIPDLSLSSNWISFQI